MSGGSRKAYLAFYRIHSQKIRLQPGREISLYKLTGRQKFSLVNCLEGLGSRIEGDNSVIIIVSKQLLSAPEFIRIELFQQELCEFLGLSNLVVALTKLLCS